eukprot:Skav210789  [mRNA]  locus=scaffold275:148382:152088:+ [translate_table: standard]
MLPRGRAACSAMGSFGAMYRLVCLAVCLMHAVAHPCEAEVQSACPERASSELARCLKDKSEHESPTEISSECADFIALNAACADDIVKSCDEASDGDGPTDELGMSEKDRAQSYGEACLVGWLVGRLVGSQDWFLGTSSRDRQIIVCDVLPGEATRWPQCRHRKDQAWKDLQDREQDKELEALKKEDPVAYKQLMKARRGGLRGLQLAVVQLLQEREEAEKSFEAWHCSSLSHTAGS